MSFMSASTIFSHSDNSAPELWPGEPRASVLTKKTAALTSGYRTYLATSDAHLHSLSLNRGTLIEWWRNRQSGGFLSAPRISELREIYESRDLERSLVIRRAEHLVNGKMPLLSHDPVEFSGEGRWRRDHILKRTAPQGLLSELDILDTNIVGDIRRLWEPSRFGWAYWLGEAYLISGDIRFADTFEELTLDWFAQNPFSDGVNYFSTKEISLRLYAWIHALGMFADYLTRKPEALSALLNGIWLHANLLQQRMGLLTGSEINMIVPSFALFAAGALVPEFAESYRWRSVGKQGLVKSIDTEFLFDGTHSSHSASEILYATDCFVHSLLIARKSGFEIDEVISKHTKKIARRLAELVPPDLILPQLNDCDGGSLCGFGLSPRDAAPALRAAGELFDDLALPDGDRIPAGYALWMTKLTDENTLASEEMLIRASVLTSSADSPDSDPACQAALISHRNEHGDYLLLRRQSLDQELSSAHDAPGGFTLYLNSRPLVVDNGTGSFTLRSARETFRSARGKNALLVNGAGPSQQSGLFGWREFAATRLVTSRRFDGGFYVLIRSDGYSRACGFSVETEREFILLDEGLALLIDSWESEREIGASLELTVTPELQISRSGRMLFEEDGALVHYLISPQFAVIDVADETDPLNVDAEDRSEDGSAESAESEDPELMRDIRFRPKIISRPFSPDYGIIGESPALVSEFHAARSGAVVTIFSRIGPVKNTADLARFTVGDEDSERELLVGASGKISLEGARHGPRREPSLVFAR